MPGFYQVGVHGCRKCLCDPLGSIGNDKCNPITGSCSCKERVTGGKCDQCMYGYYGFTADFPQICLPCYCSGQTRECDAAKDYYLLNVSTTFNIGSSNNSILGWHSVDINGYAIGQSIWEWAPLYTIGRGYVRLMDNGDKSSVHLYFSAPLIFLGNKLSSYMYFLKFDLTQEHSIEPLGYTNMGDILIKGVGLPYRLVTKLVLPPRIHQHFRSYQIQFYEKHWRKNTLDGVSPTSIEMRETLNNLEFIWIRGKWTKRNGKFSGLSNVYMDYSSYNVKIKNGLRAVKNMEYCRCPEQFSGQFCQHCKQGYTKVSVASSFTCIRCECHHHAKSCSPSNGTCYGCMHNTVGPSCSTCANGYYGNPFLGTPLDCKECACPGGLRAANQFSNKCVLNVDSVENPYRCLQCQEGYTGHRCHICSDGYYGNPMKPLGKCRKCLCNGHIDPSASSNCDTSTGECLRCLYNTIGRSCELCKPGFYGNAVTEVCKECACSKVGALDNKCHHFTGQCNCRPNVKGRKCDWM